MILVRHSKAENRDCSVNDFNRSLTVEGKSDSVKMANYLLNAGIIPDSIVTSSAARAFETSIFFASVFKINEKNISATRKLYYCSAKTILNQVYNLPETINCLMVVAHNPGISDLTRGLTAGRSFFMENTQVIVLEFDIEQWYEVDNIKPLKFEIFSLRDIR
jgi:phosphohistidine phosphatase